jgi:hypothetical protein
MLKTNLLEAQSPDVTPVWQEHMPLQIVFDGTEEVTQKHNTQAHQQKFRMHSRRKASKLKTVQAAAAAHPDDLPDKPCAAKRKAPRNSQQESPAATIPRVSPAGVTRRHSPRIAATSHATTTSRYSPSLGKTRLVKRHRTVDETYVPDADADVAVEDAGAAGQHVDDKVTIFPFCLVFLYVIFFM